MLQSVSVLVCSLSDARIKNARITCPQIIYDLSKQRGKQGGERGASVVLDRQEAH